MESIPVIILDCWEMDEVERGLLVMRGESGLDGEVDRVVSSALSLVNFLQPLNATFK